MKDAIRLKARVFVPKPGLGDGLQSYFHKMAEEEMVHVLVQFDVIPGSDERKILEKDVRLHLLDPVPERAFFAAMPADMALAKQLLGMEKPARWVGVIEPEYKVGPWLLRDGIPEHAKRPGTKAELIIEFFGDVVVEHQKDILVKHGADILTRIDPINGWRVFLDESAILSIAGEDPVKWIVEIPLPPEDDNDGVRSVTGVNADAVLPPTTYNLTGSGVVIGQWESTNASLAHTDFAGRITLGDPPIPANDRTNCHDETVSANNQFDIGEGIYRDIDDSGTVSADDVRATTVGTYAAGSIVAAADTDVGETLVFFNYSSVTPNYTELFHDSVTVDYAYTDGEAIYRDNDNSRDVSDGDTRLTAVGSYTVGSIVATGDTDIGNYTWPFPTNPHYHSTHVAGTAIGSGAQSIAS